MKNVICYINQFFAGIGGEDKADYKPEVRDGVMGPTAAINQMLAEIDQKNSVKTIKPSLEGLDLGYDTGMLMKEDLSLFGEKRTEILEHFEALMGDKAADE